MEFSVKMRSAKWEIHFCRMVDLVLKGNPFGREICFAGKLVWQGNSSLFNSSKTFLLVLVVKHITCDKKVGEIMWFCDFFQRNYVGGSSK